MPKKTVAAALSLGMLLSGCASTTTTPEPSGDPAASDSLTTVLVRLNADRSDFEAKLFTIDDPQAVLERAEQLWAAWFFANPGTPDENGDLYNRWPSSGCWYFDPQPTHSLDGAPETTGLPQWPDTLPAAHCGPSQMLDVDQVPADGWPADMTAINLSELTRIDGDRLTIRDEQPPAVYEARGWDDGWVSESNALGTNPGDTFFRPDGTRTTWADLHRQTASETPQVAPATVPITGAAFWVEALEITEQVVGFASVGVDVARDQPTAPDVTKLIDDLATAVNAVEQADTQLRDTWDPWADEATHENAAAVVDLVEQVTIAYSAVAQQVDVTNSLVEHVDQEAARIERLRTRNGLNDDMLQALNQLEALNEQVRAADGRWHPNE